MITPEDWTGRVFGEWTVIALGDPAQGKHQKYIRWVCRCSCGTERPVYASNLRNGVSTNCGCKRTRNGAPIRVPAQRHGMVGTTEHRIWTGMLTRCRNIGAPDYGRYGGRGIKVCDRWTEFTNFYADMGDRPGSDYSLDRIDNDGDYSPDNCRWATATEQHRNTSTNRLMTKDGETMSVASWSDRTGIPRGVLYDRIRYGWDDDRALTTPPRSYGQVR